MDTHFMSANEDRTMLVPVLKKHIPELATLAIGLTLFIFSVRWTLLGDLSMASALFALALITTVIQNRLRAHSLRKYPRTVFNHDRVNPLTFQSSLLGKHKIPMEVVSSLEMTSEVITIEQGKGYLLYRLYAIIQGFDTGQEPQRVYLCSSKSRTEIMKISKRLNLIGGLDLVTAKLD